MLMKIFIIFFKIGTFSIGGGYAIIPFIQEEIVNKNGWITSKVFSDIITISQMTPGPLAVNTSTFVGLELYGIAGAIVATVACVITGVVIALSLNRFFKKNANSIYVYKILSTLKVSSVGLIASAASSIVLLAIFNSNSLSQLITNFAGIDFKAIIILLISLLLIKKYKLNPMLVLTISGISGIFMY